MTADRKVAVVGAALACGAIAVAVGLRSLTTTQITLFDTNLVWWHFVLAFGVTEIAVAHIEIRREAVTLSLSESVLLVALVTLSPFQAIAARTLGGALAMAWRRPSPQKALFNFANFAAEAAVAAVIFHVLFRVEDEGAALWAAAGAAVLVAALFSVTTVAVVISFFDDNRPAGLLRSALGVQAVIAIPSISLAIIGAAAVNESTANLIAVCLAFGGIVMLLRREATTTQRASDMEAIGLFTARLVGLTRTPEVTEASLAEIARTMRGNRAAIVLPRTNPLPTQTYHLDTDEVHALVEYNFWSLLDDLTEPRLVKQMVVDGETTIPACVAAPIAVNHQRGMIVVWDRATAIGHFLPRDPATLGSMADQLTVALGRAGLIDQLHYDAHHDALTELPNRLGFSDLLASCDQLSGALLVLDLDRFKDINDTLGHPTGDRVLQIVAQRLDQSVGQGSMLARLGGDEFAVYDQAVKTAPEAAELAARVTAEVEEAVRIEDLSLQLGVSIGIALAPVHGDNLTSLMSHADTAMYEAKASQSGWQFYRQDSDSNDPRRLELVTDLRRAIDERSLDVWYQPRIRMADRSVVGAEALARWNHERYGDVSPDEFIVLAEGAGLMRDLTDAILERTISDVRRWGDSGIELPIAVNLSARNLLDDSLSSRVGKLLSTNKIPPGRLSFEITETAIMSDRERVAALLGEFHELSITLAIDDYGTGYSSLTYLRELPVDELKIDRSFISNVDFDPHNEVIVRSTIEMAHNLGLKVVAEGIEREEEFVLLASLGCDFAQGDLMSKAIPCPTFEQWLAVNGHAPHPPIIAEPKQPSP